MMRDLSFLGGRASIGSQSCNQGPTSHNQAVVVLGIGGLGLAPVIKRILMRIMIIGKSGKDKNIGRFTFSVVVIYWREILTFKVTSSQFQEN